MVHYDSEPPIYLTDDTSGQWLGMNNIEDCPSIGRVMLVLFNIMILVL